MSPSFGDEGVPLPGGFINQVYRVGDTVRRPPPERAEFVHALLVHLERQGWSGAPRFLGTDQQGREILSYVNGYVPWSAVEPAQLWSPDTLAAVGALVRGLHDLTAGTVLSADQEVVCHNDLSPRNTVYRSLGAGFWPVAFLDWDLAGPGERIADVAHACWLYVGFGPGCPDARRAGSLARALTDGYGLSDRSRLVDRILRWQEDTWRGIEAGIAAGDRRFDRLRDAGTVAAVREQQQWTEEHRATLEAALSA